MSKHVLITGASGGVGQAIAMKLAEEGCHLYLHYNKNRRAIDSLVEKLSPFGGEYMPVKADLAEGDGHEQLAASIFALDGIVHCSGTALYGLLTDLNAQPAEMLMRLHVTSPMLLTAILLPKLFAKRKGSVVVISSIWGQTGGANEVAYSAAKGGQIAFVKALSKEVALSGIRVNAVAPGAVRTQMMDAFSEEELDHLTNEIPMGRLAHASEVAEAVSFLLSDRSSYITGHILPVNGGWYT